MAEHESLSRRERRQRARAAAIEAAQTEIEARRGRIEEIGQERPQIYAEYERIRDELAPLQTDLRDLDRERERILLELAAYERIIESGGVKRYKIRQKTCVS